MGQGRSTKFISMIQWIRTRRLSMKNNSSLLKRERSCAKVCCSLALEGRHGSGSLVLLSRRSFFSLGTARMWRNGDSSLNTPRKLQNTWRAQTRLRTSKRLTSSSLNPNTCRTISICFFHVHCCTIYKLKVRACAKRHQRPRGKSEGGYTCGAGPTRRPPGT